MQYTKQEFVQKIKETYPQYQSVDDNELYDKMIAKYPQYQSQIKQGDGDTGAVDFVQGVAKSAGGTILGLGTLGRKAQTLISKGGDAVFGKYNPLKMGSTDSVFDAGSEKNLAAQELVKADTKGEKFGKFVGDVAQFAVPGSMGTKATAGMSMATRAATQGVIGAGVQAAKTGDIGKDELIVGATSALMVPAGDLATKTLQSMSSSLPEWLVRPLLKQAPGARLQGKDAAKYLVESGNIGTVDSLIQQSDEAMNALNSQIDDLIAQGTGKGITISRDQLVTDLVSKINTAGGAIDETQLLGTIDNLAPQARGLLNKPTLTLQEANQLRKLLDGTLGDKAFFAKELTFNKEVLMDFTNSLRESVKSAFNPADDVVVSQIQNQLTSAQQVLGNLPEEKIAQMGGMKALLEQSKTNIVNGLRANGMDDAATKIANIATDAFDSPEQYKEALLGALNPIRPLYNEFAKNITIKKALLSRATAGGGANSVGMYDLLAGGATFTATGNPVLGLIAAGSRRALESAPVKTALAQVFKNTDKLIPVLEAMAPESRAVILELISSLAEDEPAKPAKPAQSAPTSPTR